MTFIFLNCIHGRMVSASCTFQFFAVFDSLYMRACHNNVYMFSDHGCLFAFELQFLSLNLETAVNPILLISSFETVF